MRKVTFGYPSDSGIKKKTFSCGSVSLGSHPDRVAADGAVERSVDVWIEIKDIDVRAVLAAGEPTHLEYEQPAVGHVEHSGALSPSENDMTLKFFVGGSYPIQGRRTRR